MSKADGKRYEIRTVADFYQVPDESLEACLADFAAHLLISKAVMATARDGVRHLNPDVFMWIDDGQHNVNVTITTQVSHD